MGFFAGQSHIDTQGGVKRMNLTDGYKKGKQSGIKDEGSVSNLTSAIHIAVLLKNKMRVRI